MLPSLGNDLNAAGETPTTAFQFGPDGLAEATLVSCSFILFTNIRSGNVRQEWFSKDGSSQFSASQLDRYPGLQVSSQDGTFQWVASW